MTTPTFSTSERTIYARVLVALFEQWGLLQEDFLMLLGMNSSSRPTFRRYREGCPVAQRRDLLERVSHLCTLHAALLPLGAPSPLPNWWSERVLRIGVTPLGIAREHGIVGLAALRYHLQGKHASAVRSQSPWKSLGLKAAEVRAVQRLIGAFNLSDQKIISVKLLGHSRDGQQGAGR